MKYILVKQIFQNVDMRYGEEKLYKIICEDKSTNITHPDQLRNGEVFIFKNKADHIMKILTNQGTFYKKLPKKQSFSGINRMQQILEQIGKCLGVNLKLSTKSRNTLSTINIISS